MSHARWESFYNTTREAGLKPAGMDFRRAYDLRFINKRVGLT